MLLYTIVGLVYSMSFSDMLELYDWALQNSPVHPAPFGSVDSSERSSQSYTWLHLA